MVGSHAPCDRQDITRARNIQDIGVLLVVDSKGTLLAISSGHAERGWVKRPVAITELEEVHVSDVLLAEICAVIEPCIDDEDITPKVTTHICDIFFAYRTYVTVLQQLDGRFVVEIEDFKRHHCPTNNNIVDTSNVMSKITANTSEVGTVNDLCEAIFRHSSYDRAMTYKFLDDGCGEVVHELMDENVVKSSFLGMRFPSGDIPLPARKAYVDNPVRFISDTHEDSCFLIHQRDISLSRTFLRGCVLPHRSYLLAMGVRSSLSIAITNMEGELWGLVALHSYTKKVIPSIEDRVFFTILSSVASGHVKHLESIRSMALEKKVKEMVLEIDVKKSLGVFLIQNKENLLETFRVDSVSLFTPDGPPTIVGENGVNLEDLPVDYNSLVYGELKNPLRSFACLSILDFRFVFTRISSYNPINWAGNPEEVHVSEVSPDLVMPRRSFEEYMDHQSQNAPPFTKNDEVVLSRTGELLKSVIHQMNMVDTERKIVNTTRKSDLIEMKSDENYAFFANMSHELRTPLHAITGVLEIIRDMVKEDDKEHKEICRYSCIGLESAKDMMNTLNDILTIVRQTHEVNHTDVSLVVVKELFNSTCNGLRVFANKNNVDMNVSFACHTDQLVRVDAPRILQIFNNIGSNAIKYSGHGTRVRIEIRILNSETTVNERWSIASSEYAHQHTATEDWAGHDTGKSWKWLVVETQDQGCGIHVDDMGSIFNKFKQLGDIVTKAFASTGLGLYICLLNASALKGFLALASTQNKGTLFFCAIPVECINSNAEEPSLKNVRGSDPTQGLGNKPSVFVIVDDSNVNLMIAKKQIEKGFADAKLYTAKNGKLGLEEIGRLEGEGVHVDGIFMDVHMPVMSGLEAVRQIRKLKNRTPITMLTADITETSRQSMFSFGADFILLKPSRPVEIVEMCANMMKLKR